MTAGFLGFLILLGIDNINSIYLAFAGPFVIAILVAFLYSMLMRREIGPRLVYSLVIVIMFLIGTHIFTAFMWNYAGTGGGAAFAGIAFLISWPILWLGGLSRRIGLNIGILSLGILTQLPYSGLGFIVLSLSYGLHAKGSKVSRMTVITLDIVGIVITSYFVLSSCGYFPSNFCSKVI